MTDPHMAVFPWGNVRWSAEAERALGGKEGFARNGARPEELKKMMSSMQEPEKWKPAIADVSMFQMMFEPFGKEMEALLTQPALPHGSPEWHVARRGMFTASDAAPVMGALQGKSMRTVLKKKRSPEESHPVWQQACDWGNQYESQALTVFQLFTDLHYARTNCGLYTHPVEEYVGATPDAILLPDKVVEVKCPFTHNQNSKLDTCSLDSESIPRKYYWQIQQQLYVTGLREAVLLQYRPFSPFQKACLAISLVEFCPADMLPLLYIYKNHQSLLPQQDPKLVNPIFDEKEGGWQVVDLEGKPLMPKKKKKKRKKRRRKSSSSSKKTGDCTEAELHAFLQLM